tara:strand:+ start:2881 stop:4731 length:1851 start_codon:yes stop_codon:yes gene_type:complete
VIIRKYILLYISFLLITVKWIISYYFFPDPIDLRIIFDSVTDGKYYFPLIKYLSNLNLNISFDPEIENLNIIPIPFTSLVFHSLFFNILGFYSFIFLEFVALTILITLFYNINRFIFSRKISLFLSILLLASPIIIKHSFLYEIQYLKVFSSNLFNFRVPRPMISNLFLFSFIYLIIKMNLSKFYKKKNFISLGIILGLSLSSFYYHFFLQFLAIFILLIIKFKKNIFNEIIIKFKYYFLTIISFLITTTPFLINLYFHETDFTSRQCVFNLELNNKITLIKFYLNQYSELKFFILLTSITIITIIINLYNLKNKNFLNIFYLLFISSVLNPIFFILISSKACVFYHFNNLIIIMSLIYFIFLLQIIFRFLLEKKILNKVFNYLTLILIIFYCYNFYYSASKNFNDHDYNNLRKEFKIVTNSIKKIDKLNNISILTFENDFMIWAIINDVKYLNLINGLFSPKKDFMIEEDIYSSFKILNLKDKNFEKFLRNDNEKSDWRYLNSNISKFFFYKYQANSMITFKKSLDFELDELEYINKSSPILQQQSIIPKFEMERLKNEFTKFNKKTLDPNFIILSKNDNFYNIDELNLQNFCLLFNGKEFVLYKNKLKYECKVN